MGVLPPELPPLVVGVEPPPPVDELLRARSGTA